MTVKKARITTKTKPKKMANKPAKKATNKTADKAPNKAPNKAAKRLVLQAKNLKKSFFNTQNQNASVSILRGLNLDLCADQTVAIMGKSGSGKSTLLSILAGLEPIDEGSLMVSDTDIFKLSEGERTQFRAKHISIVFQQFHLINHLTAIDNVALPLEILKKSSPEKSSMTDSEIIKQAKEMLKQVELSHRFDHFPHQLSGGEQQRLAIARAMIVRPTLLLADEPTGNLDQETGQKVIKALFDIVKKNGISMLLVTHDESLAKKCDHYYHLVLGKLEQAKKRKK